MTKDQIDILNEACDGDRFMVEVRCVAEEKTTEGESTMFITKQDGSVILVDKFFAVRKMTKIA
ncbi:hypothetical protein LZD49_26415 [Dyadobacter sp. CY261]|uniref:hypothetical protein n=1 Tax=Dyadobacter sp. CY261 TaxID=2907203 RepID=UPI001F25DDF7|nr:hypothetical protein [Dyadobacter sp. CY261]MCF0074044.1 hypothetical protein [Dyadobacter sp. CY261]